jgi:CBS domain-containing protein
MKVSTILATKGANVVTIPPDAAVSEAVRLFSKHDIGALVVMDAQQLLGILSERDVVRQLPHYEHIMDVPVQDLMTPRVIVGRPHDDLASIVHTMTEKRFRHLPIVEDGRLIGIISIGDVLKAQRDQYRGEISTLETQIIG